MSGRGYEATNWYCACDPWGRIFTGAYGPLLVAIIGGPVGASIDGSHIAYTANISYAGILIALYIVATCGSCLMASNRWLALLDLANLTAVTALGWITFTGFTSLWCAWAAATSVAIAIYLRRSGRTGAPATWPMSDQADAAVTHSSPLHSTSGVLIARTGAARKSHPGSGQLLEVADQLLAARWMAEFAQCLDLDLTDPFARHSESLTHFLQCSLLTVDEPEAEL